ncbi:MAG: glycosyltransferase family 39 protein [Abditibacteriales bacterium]|nr:glycosyltransferase family 39 protein [Abditibacteriales bacterium]MDW8367738.1 glycosyltransferase family 39 protein [Abditibacteriales bacterium]
MDTSLSTIQFVAVDAPVDIERRFLNRLFWGAFAVRAVIGLIILLFDLQMFNGDNVHYEATGWGLSEVWSGNATWDTVTLHTASDFNTGMFFWVAAIYFLLGGRWVVVPLAVNWAVGAVNALLIYHIAKQLFNVEVARRASLLVAFLPMFAFWSALLYKEAIVLMFIALSIYATLQLQRRLSVMYALLLALSLLGLQMFRAYLSYLMGASIVLAFLVAPKREAHKGLNYPTRVAMLSILLVFAAAFGGLQRAKGHLESQLNVSALERLMSSRVELATSGASGFLAEVDTSTLSGALSYLPKGMAYLLLAPAPWQFGSVRQTMAIPETLLWYALIPFTLVGMANAWRHRRSETLVIFAFTFSLTLFYALFIGNIGTAVRERTQMFAFWFIFAAAGLVLKKRGRLDASAR